MYYLIKSISGIFVTTMDKQEIQSKIQKIESGVSMYYGNTTLDSQRRLQFIKDVLNFLDTAFTKELYHVEQWKQKILRSYENEKATSGYGWTQVEASNILLQVKTLVIYGNIIPFNALPTCRHEISAPIPHKNNVEQKQTDKEDRIIGHAASALLHAGMFLYAQYTYNFYNEIVAKFENEQRILHRQLTPYESRLLTWAREERDSARDSKIKKGIGLFAHGTFATIGIIDESIQQNNEYEKQYCMRNTMR